MSFQISAAANPDFYFAPRSEALGDTFEAYQTLAVLREMAMTPVGVASGSLDRKAPGIIDLFEEIAFRESLHNLSNAVSILAMCSGASDGSIFIGMRQTNTFSPDVARSATYTFLPGDNPAYELVQKIAQPLKDTEMNTWNVLMMLATVLSQYAGKIASSGTPKILINLSS
ncbi:MAG: hypothetical protein ABI999_08370 [Acidobacteriota bacterium]